LQATLPLCRLLYSGDQLRRPYLHPSGRWLHAIAPSTGWGASTFILHGRSAVEETPPVTNSSSRVGDGKPAAFADLAKANRLVEAIIAEV
jgi:hypothetical protein